MVLPALAGVSFRVLACVQGADELCMVDCYIKKENPLTHFDELIEVLLVLALIDQGLDVMELGGGGSLDCFCLGGGESASASRDGPRLCVGLVGACLEVEAEHRSAKCCLRSFKAYSFRSKAIALSSLVHCEGCIGPSVAILASSVAVVLSGIDGLQIVPRLLSGVDPLALGSFTWSGIVM